jgi:DNA recombination protein RmuC
MDIIAIVVGLIILAVLIFVIQKISDLKKPEDEGAQKIMLDLIENLRKEVEKGSKESRKEIEEKLNVITERLHKGLTDSSKTLQTQFKQSAGIIKDVTEKLSKLDETNKQVLDFSTQLQSLENILKNPKQRGILGEYFLETLLANVLQPNQYKIQYSFKSGEIVDAVIFFKDKIIPIDAKFSLEKYNKIMEEKNKDKRTKLEKEFKMDIKNRIDETAKYIRPAENTTDFAFMFIPAEGIYYNLLIYKVGTVEINTHDLIEYAFKKHVIVVSPTSFYAYLETVLQGLKALKMEESVKDILKKVETLGRHLNSYEDHMQRVGKHLGTTVSAYGEASKEYKKIDKDIYKLTEGKEGGKFENLVLEKPSDE